MKYDKGTTTLQMTLIQDLNCNNHLIVILTANCPQLGKFSHLARTKVTNVLEWGKATLKKWTVEKNFKHRGKIVTLFTALTFLSLSELPQL